jgi:meso-butanediol dehydrogenase / (S,S)-butanediol dehydrogenase / diacetyl reductase
MRLEGKVAIITGGGTGIGAATSALFRKEGAEVVIMGRRPEPLDDVAATTGAIAFPGDATDTADVAAVVDLACERFGGIDVVVANAGGGIRGAATEVDDETWQQVFDANLTAAFKLSRAALPSLIERKGAIVIVSSLAGLFAGPGVVCYTTMKHGLTGLTRSMARDYGPLGVRVNSVNPMWVKTPMADVAMDALAAARGITREQAYELSTVDVPIRRAGEPEEVASICLFLASPESSLIQGAVIMADGGAHIVDLPTLALAHMAD